MNRLLPDRDVAAGLLPSVRQWLASFGVALLAGCGAHVGDGTALGGETHFLVTCGEDCGVGLSCIAGACTRRCEPGFSSCSELASNAQCVGEPERGERAVFGGTCDVPCAGDLDCAPLGTGYACRSGACRAEPEDRQAALGSARQSLVRAVDADTCDSGLRWAGGERASAEMRPGSDCLACHDGASARPLLLGGTVYPMGKYNGPQPLDDCFGLEGIEVIVTDADGRKRSTVSNRAGNFYFEGKGSDFTMPYRAELRYELDGRAQTPVMAQQPYYGGCARCHNLDLEEYRRQHEADGLLPYVPPEEEEIDAPERVVPAQAPIFPPALYPN